MICHVFAMKYAEDADPALVRALLDELAELPQKIDGISSFRAGPDIGLNPGNADFVIVAEFATEADWREYLTSPAHVRFAKEFVEPVRGQSSAIQITL